MECIEDSGEVLFANVVIAQVLDMREGLNESHYTVLAGASALLFVRVAARVVMAITAVFVDAKVRDAVTPRPAVTFLYSG